MRQRLPLVPIVLTLLALALAPAFPAAPPARAQPADDAPRIHATMFHHVISWTAAPGDRFEVTLSDAVGKEKGYVWAWADAEGLVRVKLVARTNDFAYRKLEPGDRLLITRFAGPELLDLEIPDASADITDDGRRIVGRAPAGARLAVALEPRGTAAPFTADLVAGVDGGISLNLPDEAVLRPGEGGKLSLTHADGHVFDMQLARRRVEIQLGSAYAEARVTLETPLSIRRRVDFGDRIALRSLGRLNPRPEGPPTDGRATYSDDARYRITAGTVVTFSQQGGPLGRTDDFVRTLPDLAIQVDGQRRLIGHGPPGALLEVDVLPPELAGEPAPLSIRFPVVADAQGAFVLPLPESLSFAAGWRAVLRRDLGEGIAARAEVTLPQFRLSVHAARLDTRVMPFQTMTVTLLAPDGSQRAQKAVRADEEGAISLQLDNGKTDPKSNWDILEPFRPGDTVEIDLGRGDPTRLIVPALTATSDPDAEEIRGQAVPGATVTVDVHTGSDVIRQLATSDAAGQYVVDLHGAVDIEPEVQSVVTWTDPRGHAFYVLTAPLTVQVTPGRSYLEFAPYLGYPISVTLSTAEGVTAGQGLDPTTGLIDPGSLPVSLDPIPVWFKDRLGEQVRMRPGDPVEVQAGGDSARVTVLPLDGRLHVEDDLVIGRTVPGARLQIDTAYYDVNNVTAMLTADANGFFSHSFSGSADIRYNSNVLLTLFSGRHRVQYTINAPGLLMDFSAARVSGSVEPGIDLTARLGSESAPRASALAKTDREAGFTAILRDPVGEAVEPRIGEALAILAPAAQLMREIMWVLPRLTLEFDPIAGTTRGTAEPDAQVEVSVGEAVGYPGARRPLLGDEARDFPRIAPDGTWSVDKVWQPVPGRRIEARMILPSGHVALRTHTNPLLNVQHGGSAVCGVGHPHSRVAVVAHDAAGQAIARATGRADAEGRFDLALTDATGQPLFSAKGMRVAADIGGVAAEVVLGLLEVELDRAVGQLRARVSPRAQFEIYHPGRTCLYLNDSAAWRELTGRPYGDSATVMRAGPDGAVSWTLWRPELADLGMDVAVYTPEGHRYYRSVYMPLSGLAYVGSDRLAGRAPPDGLVKVTLRTSEGILLVDGGVGVDTRGRFDLRLTGAGGAAIRLSPGDRLELIAGSDQAALTVEPLSFDYSPEVGIQGQAPPDRALRLGLAFRQDAPATFDYFDLRSDAAGRFTLLASDLSPRGSWTFADVTAIDIALPQAGGHATVAEWRAEDRPEERPRLLFLPWAGRSE